MKISAQQYWALLAKYLQSQRGQVIWLAILLLGNIGLQLVNPQIMRLARGRSIAQRLHKGGMFQRS
jgi:hypothetical protein